MELSILETGLREADGDVLLVGKWEGEGLTGAAAEADRILEGELSHAESLGESGELSGKLAEIATFYPRGRAAAKRIAVIGLGKRSESTVRTLANACGAAVRKLRERGVRTLVSALHASFELEPAAAAALSAEGALLGEWEPDSHKKMEARSPAVAHLRILFPPEDSGAARAGMARGRILGESANFARDLVNAPPNELTPAAMAERTRAMAADAGLPCEVLDEDAMFRHGMGGILAVSVGSENRARLIVLRHAPNPGPPELALVGKGITFDTGGISIKPREGMEAMKGDMAGAAAVIGAMRAISLLKLPVNVVGVTPCAENMPSGKAFRPGDVIRFMNGKTSEIISTDAEGRLVLADALTYSARNLRARRMVDAATLTGACVIALGRICSGAMGSNAEWLDAVRRSADAAGERVWELPLLPEYSELIKSDIADMKNSGGREGGAITAAAFLKEFVDETPWVHLDIAGTEHVDKPLPYLAKGPSGVMVRTFVYLAESLSASP